MNSYKDVREQYDGDEMRDHYINWVTEFHKNNYFITESIFQVLPALDEKKVLDVGCAHGNMMKLIESSGSALVFGVDISKEMVNEAKKRVTNPSNVFLADIEKMIMFEDNFFDIIIGRYTLHYLKNFKKAYVEFNRVLKVEGLLVLVVHHPLMDLILQKEQVYGKKEIVTLDVNEYGSDFQIIYPSHTIEEYFSDEFFGFFYLDYFKEFKDQDDGLVHSMLIKAVKRRI
jgi:ubiquinone/menaquinone biosynthesis C-methylase UbiE